MVWTRVTAPVQPKSSHFLPVNSTVPGTSAWFFESPSIDIEKATNGVDADDPNAGDAPQIAMPGGLVTWTYVVTNTGNEPLNNVVVTDDQGVALSCLSQPAVLNPGASFDLYGLRSGR